jgi:N-terminal conserved domain of Nudc.
MGDRDLERFDTALLGVASAISASASPGENPIETLLDCYFGFLRRKTDFFRCVAVHLRAYAVLLNARLAGPPMSLRKRCGLSSHLTRPWCCAVAAAGAQKHATSC